VYSELRNKTNVDPQFIQICAAHLLPAFNIALFIVMKNELTSQLF